MEQIVANPTLWAQVGGLSGLVIFALFGVLFMFLRAMPKMFDRHSEELRGLLDLHAKERAEWGKIVDSRQQETNSAISAMTAAIHKIVSRHHDEDRS
jgi:hypothetical protein